MEIARLREQLESHHAACFAWALQCCGHDRQEAEDVLQTVYLRILEDRARFEGRSSLRTWLFAVIRNTAARARRWQAVRWRRLVSDDGRADVVAPGGPAPDELVLRDERDAALAAALDRLPPRQREVLLLVFYHGHTVDEAAAILGIGDGTARTHYARGKLRLRETLALSEVAR